jgi:Flp pilus assembly protein TadD
MVRTVAMSAASALCLIWTAGCATTSEPAAKPAATAANPVSLQENSPSNAAAFGGNLPGTIDGEISRAEKLRRDGNYDEAVRSLAQIMLIAPDNARVIGEYGKTLEQQGRAKEALAFLTRALALQPNDWKLYSDLGIAYDQLDNHASARTAYERALAIRPLEPSVLNNYAVSRMLAGDYPSAQRLFTEASAQGARNPKIALNLQKLAALEPHAPAAEAPAPVAVATPRHAEAIVKAADLKPVPVAAATKAGAQPKTVSNARFATAAPKSLGAQVVMERVPVDPLAGPVREKHGTPKLAKAGAPKASSAPAKPAAPTPSLRTAADSD